MPYVTRKELLFLIAGAASSAVFATVALTPALEASPATTSTSYAAARPDRAAFEACLTELRSQLPADCLSEDLVDLRAHGIGQWTEQPPRSLPGLVVYPRNTQDVVAIVKAANRHGVPLIPYGAGTSIEGQINAPAVAMGEDGELRPGYAISISLGAHMNEIVELHEADLTVTVQPGLGYEELNAQLANEGIPLFFPVDPGPGATIGGMVATGCSGTNAVLYKTMREATLNLTVVLPSGEVVKTRSRAAKSSAGPDLTKLFVGSEGTLGIIVEATIKLAPVVPSTVGVVTFDHVQGAASVVAQMQRQGVTVQCLELLDDSLLRAINAASKRNRDGLRHYAEKPTLFIKMQGDASAIQSTQAKIAAIARQYGGDEIVLARTAEESDALWRARKVALNSAFAMAPGAKFHSTDVCVPISQLPTLITELQADLASRDFTYTGIIGHAGDGNLHTIILFETEEQDKAAMAFADRMARRAQELGGTCTGEHGVGVGKKHLLYNELGGAVDLLRDIKYRVIDPRGIMNPGTLLPPPR